MQKPYNSISLEGKANVVTWRYIASCILYPFSYMTTISYQSAMTVDKFQGELSKLLVQCTRLFN